MEASVYTQAFEAGNEEADLLLSPNPYGFDFFESHFASSSAPAPVPTPAQAVHQPTNQDGNLDLEQLSATRQPNEQYNTPSQIYAISIPSLQVRLIKSYFANFIYI
ncbi:hypothetical protein DSO57_1025797 [Entomophthora muscae]|uniref:Uncharacterized protein n=1 Tax=Entomophthora muscae TaxID=34485 RepID=A0ACC2SRH8_9FUNG|nr:hypothetical protein DSO57_1025797 [Entomophthora muscae]